MKKKIKNWMDKVQAQLTINPRIWQLFFFLIGGPICFLETIDISYIIFNWDQIIKNPVYSTSITWYNEQFILFSILSLIILFIAMERFNSYMTKNFDSTKGNQVLFFLQCALFFGFLIHLFLFLINLEIAYNLWNQKETLYTTKIWFLSDVTRGMTEEEAWIQFQNAILAYSESLVLPEECLNFFEIIKREWVVEAIFEACYSLAQDHAGFTKLVTVELDGCLDAIRSTKQ